MDKVYLSERYIFFARDENGVGRWAPVEGFLWGCVFRCKFKSVTEEGYVLEG
jgi:hypothetical protein